MNIYTDTVKNKKYGCSIKAELLKHSQEYRVLATLRYLYPQKYKTMTAGESPDLQDCTGGIGIEVIAAVRENDMQANRAFAYLREESDNKKAEKLKQPIESSGYVLSSTPWGTPTISTSGTAEGDKKTFQESIRKKLTKLQDYRIKCKILGLAVIWPEMPSNEAQSHLVEWIREIVQESDDFFDFIYVISRRGCIYYDAQKDIFEKKAISGEESKSLQTIARMTAEGELSLDSQEWE